MMTIRDDIRIIDLIGGPPGAHDSALPQCPIRWSYPTNMTC